MKLQDDFYAMLGLARRAGAVLCGSFAVQKGLRAGKIRLVVADEALSQRARQELEALCRSCGRELMFAGPDGRLGQAGVTKQAFSQRLKEIYHAQRRGGETV